MHLFFFVFHVSFKRYYFEKILPCVPCKGTKTWYPFKGTKTWYPFKGTKACIPYFEKKTPQKDSLWSVRGFVQSILGGII